MPVDLHPSNDPHEPAMSRSHATAAVALEQRQPRVVSDDVGNAPRRHLHMREEPLTDGVDPGAVARPASDRIGSRCSPPALDAPPDARCDLAVGRLGSLRPAHRANTLRGRSLSTAKRSCQRARRSGYRSRSRIGPPRGRAERERRDRDVAVDQGAAPHVALAQHLALRHVEECAERRDPTASGVSANTRGAPGTWASGALRSEAGGRDDEVVPATPRLRINALRRGGRCAEGDGDVLPARAAPGTDEQSQLSGRDPAEVGHACEARGVEAREVCDRVEAPPADEGARADRERHVDRGAPGSVGRPGRPGS